jgi:hypothetical protein
VHRYAPHKTKAQPEKARSVDESLLGPERLAEETREKVNEVPLGAVLYALMVNR